MVKPAGPNSASTPQHDATSRTLEHLDPLLQHRSRLGALVLLSTVDALSFSRLRALLNETDGNLGAQLRKLEEAEYLAVRKEFLDRKPVSWYSLTTRGQRALKSHLQAMESLCATRKSSPITESNLAVPTARVTLLYSRDVLMRSLHPDNAQQQHPRRMDSTGSMRAAARWLVPAAFVVAALILRSALQPLVGMKIPYGVFIPAALLAAWYGGVWPGAVATIAGGLLGNLVFTNPSGRLTRPEDLLGLATYTAATLIGVIICESLHRARRRADMLAAHSEANSENLRREMASRAGAEQQLRREEQRYHALFDTSVDGIVLADDNGHFVELNGAFCKLLRFAREQLIGRHFSEFVFPDALGAANAAFAQLRASGEMSIEFPLRAADGSRVELEWRSRANVLPGLHLCVARDISERNRTRAAAHANELALRDSERRYRFLADSIPQIVWTARADGVTNYNNKWMFDYFGTTPEQMQKLGWTPFRHPDDRARATEMWLKSIEAGEPYECTYRLARGADKGWRWHLARAVPMRDETGQVLMWFGTCTDIHDQKLAEEALRSSEEEFRAVFELAGSGKALVEPATGRFLRVNRKLCEMTGYTSDELLRLTFSDITHVDDREWTAEQAARMIHGEIPIYSAEKRYVRKDGEVMWVHVTATLIRDAEGRPLRCAGVIQDITERKRAEQALRDSQASLARAQCIARLGSWELDVTTQRLTWSDEMFRVFGHEPNAFEPSLDRIFDAIPADDQAMVRDAIRRAIDAGESYQLDHRILLPDSTVRHVTHHAEVVHDREQRRAPRIVGTMHDITAQKQVEAQLAAANRAKDQFLATLSHELRTPLTPVVLTLGALRDDPAIPAHVRDELHMIERNVGIETKLIDDLLDLTRITRGKLELRPEIIDVHTLLDHAVRSCCGGDGQEKPLAIRSELSARDSIVRADPLRLEQVFFNLLRNAVKFTPAGGSIVVSTNTPCDGRIEIAIADSGMGIEPAVLPRIFNAFEQGDPAVTKQFGGLGLGLAVSKALVDLHGGTIRAHSDGRERGATFIVEMPLADPALRDAADLGPRGHPALGEPREAGDPAAKLKILLVEDHSETAMIMTRLLRATNYSVSTARDVGSAKQLAESKQFDLVVSDLGLPDGSGLDLMNYLRQRYGLRGIALTGFGMEDDIAHSRAAGFVEHLVKPVHFHELQTAIHRVTKDAGIGV